MDEREERAIYLIDEEEKYSNLKIHLRNKTLNLWDSFFFLSNLKKNGEMIENHKVQDLSLYVEENVILDFIERDTNFKRCTFLELVDYFIFFKSVGMMWLAKDIVEYVFRNIKSPREIYDVFRNLSQRFECRGLAYWFRSDINPLKSFDHEYFSHSFTLMLFCKMKDRINEFYSDDDLFILPYSDRIRKYLNSVKKNEYHLFNFRKHYDFRLVQIAIPRRDRVQLFRMLRSGNVYNMVLHSSDGVAHAVHQEVLILRLNFFQKMVSFKGREAYDLDTNRRIVLEDLNHDQHFCKLMLDYAYNDEISPEERRVDILIKALFFADKFCESGFYQKLILTLHTIKVTDRVKELEDLLFEFGWIIHRNPKMSNDLVAILQNLRRGDPWNLFGGNNIPQRVYREIWGSTDEVRRVLRQSHQTKEMMDELTDKLKEEKEELELENKELKEKVNQLEGRIVGKKRKRGELKYDDDDDDDDHVDETLFLFGESEGLQNYITCLVTPEEDLSGMDKCDFSFPIWLGDDETKENEEEKDKNLIGEDERKTKRRKID